MGQGLIIRNPTPQWLTDPSVTDSAMTKALRMIGQLIGADDPTSQVLGIMSTLVPSAGKAGGAVAKVIEKVKGIKAYHGSPHDFDKFSMEKIGTGEGAQAYGHGLYFAENPAVAADYKQKLVARNGVTPSSDAVSRFAVHNQAADGRPVNSFEFPSRAEAEAFLRSKAYKKQAAQFGYARSEIVEDKINSGRTYEVQIKADPASFLDWDKPLSEQSEYVRGAIDKAGITPHKWIDWEPYQLVKDGEIAPGSSAGQWVAVQRNANGAIEAWNGQTLLSQEGAAKNAAARNAITRDRMRDRGEYLYSDAGTKTKREATERLKQAGIPGIKYLDQGSRAAGEGSRNYVVFDDSIIDILKKYGLLPAAVGTGAAMSQEQTR